MTTKAKAKRFQLIFQRTIKFPRFTMRAGEAWDVWTSGGTGRDYLDAVATGSDRFEFAGGQCLICDIVPRGL